MGKNTHLTSTFLQVAIAALHNVHLLYVGLPNYFGQGGTFQRRLYKNLGTLVHSHLSARHSRAARTQIFHRVDHYVLPKSLRTV